jgi:Family of unknown function (DUF5678)
MSDVHTLPAPDLTRKRGADDAWEDERRAFLRLLPALVTTHRGRYVAVHKGSVIADGEDQIDVAMRAYSLAGYVPIYVGLVTNEPQEPIRLPSLRLLPRGAQ